MPDFVSVIELPQKHWTSLCTRSQVCHHPKGLQILTSTRICHTTHCPLMLPPNNANESGLWTPHGPRLYFPTQPHTDHTDKTGGSSPYNTVALARRIHIENNNPVIIHILVSHPAVCITVYARQISNQF